MWKLLKTMVTGLAVAVAFVPLMAGRAEPATAKVTEGRRLLQELIKGARQEGQLHVTVVTGQTARGAKELADAFKRRFGLDDMRITADLNPGTLPEAHKVIAEHQAGIPPTFDVMYIADELMLPLRDAGVLRRIENWEPLLAEIAPEAHKVRDKLSPSPFDGYAFTWGTRVTALLYNPKLISKDDLPKTLLEYGHPRYKGKYSVPPWITRAWIGILKYDKDKWLETVRSWGRNKAHVLTFAAGVSRLLLGELAFLYGNADYNYEHKDRDPNAPIGLSFFDDLTTLHPAMNVVLQGTRHPNAAMLFTLWSIGEEASLLFQKHSYTPNVYHGRGPLSAAISGELEKRGIKPVSWFDSPRTLEAFLWYETPEGKAYFNLLDRAQREGR